MHLIRTIYLGVLAVFATVMAASPQTSAQQQQKPNILFIMGDDIGWMQPSIYHRGLMVDRGSQLAARPGALQQCPTFPFRPPYTRPAPGARLQ
jgi:hypothetical protein